MGDASDKIDDLAGKAKEGAGRVTGDRDLEDKGKDEQDRAQFKDAAKDTIDKAKDVLDNK